MRTTVAGLMLFTLLLTACGDDDSTGVVSEPADDPRILTCGEGRTFPPSVFTTAPRPLTDTPPDRMVADDPALVGEASREWRTFETESLLMYLSGEPPQVHFVSLERSGDGWRYGGSGGCTVFVHHDGRASATWWIEEPAPRPEATEFAVLASDRQCASGVSAEERVDDGAVVEGADAVTITFTAKPLEGNQDCPSHPPARRTIRLAAPLGERRLLDGALHPPRPVCIAAAPSSHLGCPSDG